MTQGQGVVWALAHGLQAVRIIDRSLGLFGLSLSHPQTERILQQPQGEPTQAQFFCCGLLNSQWSKYGGNAPYWTG